MKILRVAFPIAFLSLMIFGVIFAQSGTAENDAAWRQGVEKWRAERQQALTSPVGWLTLVALAWVHPGENTIGSAADNSIQLDKLPAHLGSLHLAGDVVTLHVGTEKLPSDFLLNGKPAHNGGVLVADEEHPAMKLNTLSLYVIHRSDRVYLRVKDAQAETLRQFHGLNWYAPDAHYRIRARWVPSTPPVKMHISNVLGQALMMESPGVAEFRLNGQTVRLRPVLDDAGDTELSFLFRDATSATTTYQAGRFLDAEFPDHGLSKPGTIVLDFNLAYNPPCAFTPFATCPLPPVENRLKLAIPAGEKRYHDE